MGFPSGSDGKESTCNAGDLGLIPGLGRFPGGGHGNSLQYSCLKNPHEQKSLVGCSPWGHKESDMTEWLSTAQFSWVQSLSHVRLCDPMNCSMLDLPVNHQLPESTKLMSIESVMPSNHLILCRPLLLLPSVFPSIGVFSNEDNTTYLTVCWKNEPSVKCLARSLACSEHSVNVWWQS